MGMDKKEMIQQLKFEIKMIEKGGYHPSVREARRAPEIFRDSITCLNVGLEEKEHACSSCFLSEFAPAEVRNSNDDICHKIPLNEKGDTVESLKTEGDPHKLQAVVLSWFEKNRRKPGAGGCGKQVGTATRVPDKFGGSNGSTQHSGRTNLH